MIRRIALAATTAALAFGGVAVVAGPATAAPKPTITATGNVSCSITGKVKILPALTHANTVPSTTTAKVKGICTGSTEQGVTPSKVKGTVISVGNTAGTCAGLLTGGTSPFTANITWMAFGGKINPSTVVFPGLTATTSPPGFALNNGDTTEGSYAGVDNADATAFLAAGEPDFSLCAEGTTPSGKPKKAKGIKKLTIAGGSLAIT